jgi:2-polyprenyl-6-methoxyphenol hydroxylase-like FAD-dependent oxidoreductase
VPRAVIIGGGIGGLAAAVALRKVGVEVEVYERAPEIHEVGAGLSLWSNAVQALTRLGVAEALLPRASVIRSARTMNAAGKRLDETDLTRYAEKAGYPSVCAHRAELQRVLLEALPAGVVHTGAECSSVSQTDTEASATFTDGRRATGDLLIGADGLRSVVRRSLADPGPPRYAGYTAWRGIGPYAPRELGSDQGWFAVGRGCQLGLFPCGPGRLYWFVTKNAPANQSDPPGGHKSALLAAFARWHPDFRAVIEATDESVIFRNDIIDRPPSRDWGRGRITLLGDSIHATTPNLGQGACMALEDAVVLAATLRDATDLPAALRRYEDARRERTAYVTEQSWSLGKIFQWENPLLCWLRDRMSSFGKARAEAVFTKLLIHELPAL